MNRDPFKELQSMNPVPASSGASWAEENGPDVLDTVVSNEGPYIDLDEATPERFGTKMLRVAAVAVAALGLVGGYTAWVRQGEDHDRAVASQSTGAGSGDEQLKICTTLPPVEVDGKKVDWSSVSATFDSEGGFRLPDKPDWVSADLYCHSVLSAAQPAPPTPDGAENRVNGPNRFVVFDSSDDGKPTPIVLNQVLVQLYPASVHDAFDPTGRQIGFFAPGVEYVDRQDSTARSVAADRRTIEAVASIVKDCDGAEGACDSYVAAAVAVGDAALIGQPVSLS